MFPKNLSNIPMRKILEAIFANRSLEAVENQKHLDLDLEKTVRCKKTGSGRSSCRDEVGIIRILCSGQAACEECLI